MSELIRTVNLNEQSIISARDVGVYRYTRSVAINQTDGSFVVTEPLSDGGKVYLYPQQILKRS